MWSSPQIGRIIAGATSSFAGGLTTAVMRGGKVAVQQVAVDAFGNAVGERLKDQANSPPQQSDADSQAFMDVVSRFSAQ